MLLSQHLLFSGSAAMSRHGATRRSPVGSGEVLSLTTVSTAAGGQRPLTRASEMEDTLWNLRIKHTSPKRSHRVSC